jgi:exosortase H (IPTLxxWG-CTERM-specific)
MRRSGRPLKTRAAADGPRLKPARVSFHPTRFLLVFFLCLLAGFALLFTPWVQFLDVRFSRVLVRISHALIVGCGGHAIMDGAVLRSPAGAFGVEMQDGCNGVNVTILLCSAILAFPASWRFRALGFLSGSLIIQALNVVRFISLYYIGQYSLSWFDFAHAYLWESMLILDTLVIFWIWVSRAGLSGARANVNP